MTSYYVSGPMRGYPCFNFDAFDSLAAQLEADGYDVINPAQHDREVYPDIEKWEGFATGDVDACPEFNLHEALAWDLTQVAACDELVLLPGWEESSGAKHERYVAEVCNKSIWLAEHRHASWGSYWSLYYDDEQRRVSDDRVADMHRALREDEEFQRLMREEEEIEARIREIDARQPEHGRAKRVFDTGASRDATAHKPDYEGFLSPAVVLEFGRYMHKNREMADGSLRDSDNWQRGIPLDAYAKSLLRHVVQVWALHRRLEVFDYDGVTPVDIKEALCGALFNVQGYLHETLKRESEPPYVEQRLSKQELMRVDI